MLPLWFFVVLVVVIAYLLFITRPGEENISVISRNHWRKFQNLMKGNDGNL